MRMNPTSLLFTGKVPVRNSSVAPAPRRRTNPGGGLNSGMNEPKGSRPPARTWRGYLALDWRRRRRAGTGADVPSARRTAGVFGTPAQTCQGLPTKRDCCLIERRREPGLDGPAFEEKGNLEGLGTGPSEMRGMKIVSQAMVKD